MTNKVAFFLLCGGFSGNKVASKERFMPVFGRGTLAAALATAMSVAPSFAQERGLAGKPAAAVSVTQSENEPDVIALADEYSENHPVVAIGILKGQKETLLTGEQVGQKLSDALMMIHDVPSKVFVQPGGDYTAVIFAVDGLIYGPYGLKESLSGMTLAARSYDGVVRPKLRNSSESQSTFTGKPAPEQ